MFERIARGSSEALAFCAGMLAGFHTDLPPLGAVTLMLAAIALVPLLIRPLRSSRASRGAARRLRAVAPLRLRLAAMRVGLVDDVSCVDDADRYAYCAGIARPRVYLSAGAVDALRPRELEAVLWHEAHHLRMRDPLRVAIARVVAALLFVTPVVRELVQRFEIAKELEADRAALAAQGTAREMAGAMLVLGRPRVVLKLASITQWSVSSARIDQLAGTAPERLLPGISARAVILTGAALLLALILGVGQAARAHLVDLSFLPEAAAPLAHVCPLPIRGPLI
jgi:hypothetical protein